MYTQDTVAQSIPINIGRYLRHVAEKVPPVRLDIDGALVKSHDAHDRAQQSRLAAAAGSQQTVAAIEQRIVNVKY